MLSVPYAKVIVNPVAGGNSVSKDWPRICQCLHDASLCFDHEFTKGIGHAIEISRQATDIGYRMVVVVGGDGTLNEVVNGIMASANRKSITLGVVTAGTACNFARSLGIPRDYAGSCSFLISPGRALIDIGLVEYKSHGEMLQRYFISAADVGMGSAIANVWNRLPNRFGKSINYWLRTYTALRHFAKYSNIPIRLQVGEVVEDILSRDIIIANVPYFGNGMQIAPHANPNDGLFDLLTFGDFSKYELLKIWPALYRGTHIGHSKIKERKTTRVTVESDEQLFVQADGIVLGETPASFRIIPSALTIVGIELTDLEFSIMR